LQIALCQAREGAGRNATAFIVHAAPGGGFDTEFGAWTFDLGQARLEIVSSASPNGESWPRLAFSGERPSVVPVLSDDIFM
jgi:hypothetical protein